MSQLTFLALTFYLFKSLSFPIECDPLDPMLGLTQWTTYYGNPWISGDGNGLFYAIFPASTYAMMFRSFSSVGYDDIFTTFQYTGNPHCQLSVRYSCGWSQTNVQTHDLMVDSSIYRWYNVTHDLSQFPLCQNSQITITIQQVYYWTAQCYGDNICVNAKPNTDDPTTQPTGSPSHFPTSYPTNLSTGNPTKQSTLGMH